MYTVWLRRTLIFMYLKKSVDTSVERICTIENGSMGSVIPENMAIVGNYDSYCYPGISIDVLNSPEQIFTEVEEQDANLSRGDIYAVAFFPLGDLTYHDDLYFKMKYIDFAYKVRYAIFAVLAGSTIGAGILLVTLVRTAGKKDEEGRIQKSFIDKIPLELYGLMLYIVEACVAGFFWKYMGILRNEHRLPCCHCDTGSIDSNPAFSISHELLSKA